jgi:hypothetical protein
MSKRAVVAIVSQGDGAAPVANVSQTTKAT